MSNAIILENLEIIHFKGIERLAIKFDHVCQNIWGDNGTGKTTVADAFNWLLFGKNSAGESDFGIKPLSREGQKIQDIEVEVNGSILFNDRRIVLRHVFREVWKKKRGSEIAELSGNTHEYFIDGAPYSQSEYQAYVGRLVDETVFKLITNPLYFNNDKLVPWQKRRQFLLKMSGELTNDELMAINPDFKKIIDKLVNGKTVDKLKQEFAVQVKNAKEELEKIPTRIDEVRRGMPAEEDYTAIQQEIADMKVKYEELGGQLDSAAKNASAFTEKVRQHETAVRELKLQRDQVAAAIREARSKADLDDGKALREKKTELNAVTQHVTDARNSIDSLNSDRDRLNKSIESAQARITTLTQQMDAGREEWKAINGEQLEIDPHSLTCPTCKQYLPAEDMAAKRQEMEENFKKDRALRKQENEQKGRAIKGEIDGLTTSVIAYKKELGTIEQMLESRTQEHAIHLETYDNLVTEIRELESTPKVPKEPVEDTIARDEEYRLISGKIEQLASKAPKVEHDGLDEVRQERTRLSNEIIALKVRLEGKEERTRQEQRITDLKKQEKELAQSQTAAEGMLSLLAKFIKVQMDTVTERINGRFKLVKFKMFNELQNGGIEDTCEITVDGVPYSDLNTASRINAGVDVINVLSDHYGVRAPIIIDNRETIVRLLDTQSQVINLYVWENAKVLTVSSKPPAFDNSRVRAVQPALEL